MQIFLVINFKYDKNKIMSHITVGLQGPMGLRGSLKGLRGSRGRPIGSQGAKGWAYRVLWGQEIGLEDLKGSRGRPTGS